LGRSAVVARVAVRHDMSSLQSLLDRIVPALQNAGIPFMVAGSFASAAHGLPRSTNDLDIIIDPTREALDSLLAQLPPDTYYVDVDVARDALQRRGMFNVIDHATGWKIDFIFRRNRAFSRQEFERRSAMNLLGVEVFMASAEDTILAKLEWSKASGGSERQRRDIAGIIATLGDSRDQAYLQHWLRELDLESEWAIARQTPIA
jgi:hypothetical protein